ncbi:MAG: hypothetical protein IJS54_03275 [Desulfovibrio sp.]|nr:hypothetical protein [Desulfovibrio sp.]
MSLKFYIDCNGTEYYIDAATVIVSNDSKHIYIFPNNGNFIFDVFLKDVDEDDIGELLDEIDNQWFEIYDGDDFSLENEDDDDDDMDDFDLDDLDDSVNDVISITFTDMHDGKATFSVSLLRDLPKLS